jgi:hypothetical protein
MQQQEQDKTEAARSGNGNSSTTKKLVLAHSVFKYCIVGYFVKMSLNNRQGRMIQYIGDFYFIFNAQ